MTVFYLNYQFGWWGILYVRTVSLAVTAVRVLQLLI